MHPSGVVSLPRTSPTGKLLWVDSVYGNNSLAVRESLGVPFKTLTAAKTAAQSGDTIMVLPGAYTDSNLLKDGVNWHFFPGANVLAAGTIFSTGGGGGVNCMVTGQGVFSTSSGNVVNVAAGNVQIAGKEMAAGGADVVVLSGGASVIECDYIGTSTGYPVNVSGGSHRITAHRLGSSTSEAVYISGGSAIITAYEIYGESTPAIRHNSTTASLTVRHARIISNTDEAIYFATVPASNDGLKLLGCFLNGGGTHSMNAVDTVSVQLLGGCCATQEVETSNIAKIGTLTVSASFS